jgi:hypothetical protein
MDQQGLQEQDGVSVVVGVDAGTHVSPEIFYSDI